VTHRIADQLAATLAGMLATLILMALFVPDVWLPASRPSPQPDPPSGGMTTERISPLPSPETAARTGTPDGPAPLVALPEPSGTGTAALAVDADPITLRGVASWFRSPAGVSAAGPALRAAMPGWRGQIVVVTGPAGRATTVLGDAMRADKLVDLHAPVFAAVCGPLSRGICTVTLTAIPTPPDTAMGDAP
jgi:hypothetical protein